MLTEFPLIRRPPCPRPPFPQLRGAPSITVNWKARSGQKWTVPFGGGLGKVAFLGKLPVNAQVGAYVNAVKPDVGPDWQLRVQVQLLFPASLFRGKKAGGA